MAAVAEIAHEHEQFATTIDADCPTVVNSAVCVVFVQRNNYSLAVCNRSIVAKCKSTDLRII